MNESILAKFQSEPVLIDATKRDLIESQLNALANSAELKQLMAEKADNFWPEAGSVMAMFRPYAVKNGVLEIPVKGTLLKNFPFTYHGLATGYEYITQALIRGMADPEVKGIALNIDSGGGMVSGNFDLVDQIFNARSQKPVHAFANDSAYSAAYSIASAAESITVARSGGVGSIGVVTMHVDVSKAVTEAGYKITFIYAGKHKVDGNPYEPLPEKVKARIQARVDATYEEFVALVARNRGLDEKAVRDTEAQTFTATESISNKLADRIGSFDDGLVAFAAKLNSKKGEPTMNTEKKEAATVDQTQIDQARTEAKAEGFAEGAKAERDRIEGILNCEQAQTRRDSAINIALKTQLSVDQAAELLATLPEAKASVEGENAKDTFSAAMEATGNPNLGAGEAKAEEKSDAEQILADYHAVSGRKSK